MIPLDVFLRMSALSFQQGHNGSGLLWVLDEMMKRIEPPPMLPARHTQLPWPQLATWQTAPLLAPWGGSQLGGSGVPHPPCHQCHCGQGVTQGPLALCAGHAKRALSTQGATLSLSVIAPSATINRTGNSHYLELPPT